MTNLKEIDPTNIEDQNFLYDILKYRWRNKDVINIKNKTPEERPTFEQHVKNINSNNYKKIYRINFNELTIGSIYTDKNNYTGTFLLPSLIKIAIKKYGKENFNAEKIGIKAHTLMYEDLPEINVFYHCINPKNTLSLKGASRIGWELTELVFSCKTQNGKYIKNENKSI